MAKWPNSHAEFLRNLSENQAFSKDARERLQELAKREEERVGAVVQYTLAAQMAFEELKVGVHSPDRRAKARKMLLSAIHEIGKLE